MTIAKIKASATDVWAVNLPLVTAEMLIAAAPNAEIWLDGKKIKS